jgi:hypothetical protein
MNALISSGFELPLLWVPLGAVIGLAWFVWALARRAAGGAEAWMVLGPALSALVPFVAGMAIVLAWPDTPEGVRRGAVSFGAARMAIWLGPMPLMGLAAVAGAWISWRNPRSWRHAGLYAVAGMSVAAVIGVGGWVNQDLVFSGIRAATYAALVPPWSLAMAGTGERGRAVAGWAGPLLPLAVACGELSQRGLVLVLMIAQAPPLHASDWAEAVDWFYLVTRPTAQVGAAALLIATLAAGVGVARAAGATRWAGACALVAAWFAWATADLPRAQAISLAVLCEGPPTSR